jgi:triosephosphate isomerase
MQRTPLLAANWKMNTTRREAKTLVEDILGKIKDTDREVLICPPSILVDVVKAAVGNQARVAVGVQNMHFADSGAFTGEISAAMAVDAGARYAIIGHSERRAIFGESDAWCAKKVVQADANNLVPILCVGESLEQREKGITNNVVTGQLDGSLEGFRLDSGSRLVIAYEPVWAIGTGRTATPDDAEAVCKHIREHLAQRYGERISSAIRVLYGGSVSADNVDALMARPNIDGALVGGASLKAESFARIVNYQTLEKV